ncbi:hypothetical protein FQN54_002170 [Arachnomyces sp. PD_36]|nr:hypothetical protein FQN54_002170 [Arachnomyces sp. PD_36]
MASNSQSPPRCPDWVFLNNSNVHVAKDREWFTDYTPFESYLGERDDNIPVLGIGTVDLPVERSPDPSEQDPQSTLRLTNVLHAPSFLCNVLGGPILKHYAAMLGSGNPRISKGNIKDSQGQPVAYFEPGRPLFIVKLRGAPVGPRVIEPGHGYALTAYWDESERQRWRQATGQV